MKAIATLLIIPAMLLACDNSDSDNAKSVAAPTIPAPPPTSDDAVGDSDSQQNPGAFAGDYRSSPNFFTLTDGPVEGSSPHGVNQIWYSKSVEKYVGQAGFLAPLGTVAIKEADTDKDGKVDMVVVMVKKEDGFDSQNSNWSYEMRTPDGVLMDASSVGPNPMCIGCHSAWKQQDYLPGLQILAPK